MNSTLLRKDIPSRWDLDSSYDHHPIKLTHRSGRAHVLNSLALKLVGISNETADPPEGLIDRDIETGEPTGLLYGMGDYLARSDPSPRSQADGARNKTGEQAIIFSGHHVDPRRFAAQ